jgi:two-component system, chemotaxis family, chemotaxis protein CheY
MLAFQSTPRVSNRRPVMSGTPLNPKAPYRVEFAAYPILVVEDDPVVRRNIIQMLRNIGFYQIHEAADGEAGLTALKSMAHCDVVLSDISMKPVGGLKFLERVRTELQPPASEVPIVFVTGHGDEQTVNHAKRLRPAGYVLKPVKPEKLAARLAAILHLADGAAPG